DRIRSSSSFELIGSSPADGSSRKSTSGSSAMARARPARFCIPPLISDGKWSSKPRSPTSASFSSATSRISGGPRSVYSPRGRPPEVRGGGRAARERAPLERGAEGAPQAAAPGRRGGGKVGGAVPARAAGGLVQADHVSKEGALPTAAPAHDEEDVAAADRE